ncbi:hypothetical protein ACEE25_07190 [Clostridium perfringens]|uniref:hypothetical protein n=1 Tax=Clostridium perfringens TaxID=1502 RepID=UPI000E0B0A97|nr:hypothetical protein [Clostridium perfringens]AXH53470.1 hypothetical protein C8114_12900 [Clostridium perfringens]MBI6030832.1 hypothetical protein [Clostridium perfringens]MBI6034168.1 hypothetical protein [Clostridium perfringens]MCI5750254.1 hypothetical protein [Clostridium perfringens]MDY4420677.1 hypothetical protein [Clostridium perfringens]
MKYKLNHKEQTSDAYIFNDFTNVLIVCTQGFNDAFGIEAKEISLCAINSIIQRYGNSAEYLQVFEYNGIKFWAINDFDETVTMLLPEEY